MTCPHCGFLMSPLDADCARCRHRGYVPPAAPPVAPTPAYSYAPILPAPSQPQPSRALEVMACLMSVTALLGLVLFGLILHQRRNARQQAEIAALRQQLAETQQSQTYTTVRTVTTQPQIIHVEVHSPAYPVYVPAYPMYDAFAEHARRHQEFIEQQRQRLQQQTEDMQRMHAASIERMNANMQRMHDQMQSARQVSQPRARDPHDPFNPFGRF